MKPIIPLSLSLLLLSGCVNNPYSDFYRDYSSSTNDLLPYSLTTKIYATRDHQKDGAELIRQGYSMIGEAAFEAGAVTESQLRSHAKTIGADVVLCSTSLAGSYQTAMPWLQYQPGQSSTMNYTGSVQASAYGSGGYGYGTATYSGQSTTTSPGTYSTSMIPITVTRYTYSATYWRKTKSGRGAAYGQANIGCEVGAPGFAFDTHVQGFVVLKVLTIEASNAGMKAGDVITAVDGGSVLGLDFVQGIKLFMGPTSIPVLLTVNRGGASINLEMPRQKVESK